LHTLRKEYGSQINARHGIYEASRALRHADINITTQHYIRNTKRIAPELGHLLKGAENIIEMQQPNAPEAGSEEEGVVQMPPMQIRGGDKIQR
jgi:hypothetical protein